MIQLFSAYYEKHKIKQAVSEQIGRLVMEKYADLFIYKSLSMNVSYEDYERVYNNPIVSEATIIVMAQENVERIVDRLAEN